MSKPVLVFRFGQTTPFDTIEKCMPLLSNHEVQKDYHILVLHDSYRNGDLLIECYNSPKTNKEFEDLKQQVQTLLNIQNQ